MPFECLRSRKKRFRLAKALSLALVFVAICGLPAPLAALASPLDSQPVQLAAGKLHSALLLQDGSLYTWGDNSYGQLGFHDVSYQDQPRKLPWPDRIKSVSLGADHTVFVTEQGHAYAMGRNAFGQLGDGSTQPSASPVRVSGLTGVQTVSCGLWHALALLEDGSVWGWGDNSFSQLGSLPGEAILDTAGARIGHRHTQPVRIISEGAALIEAGGSFSLYADQQGVLYAWGNNDRGQLGDGTQETRTDPTAVLGLSQVRLVSAGYQSVLAVVHTAGVDQLYAWGDNSLGQLGTDDVSTGDAFQPLALHLPLDAATPAPVETIRHISMGYSHALISVEIPAANGGQRESLLAWGDNAVGQLALGDALSRSKPTLLAGSYDGFSGSAFLPFDALACGGGHTLVLSSMGLLATSGRGERGQLGTRSILNRLVLTPVPIADVIRPGWVEGARAAVSRQEDQSVVIRWPAAQDNIQLAGYRLEIAASDGSHTHQDVGLAQTWTLPARSKSDALLVTVVAYDLDNQQAPWDQLSHLMAYLPPADQPLAPASAYFDNPVLSVPLIDAASHNWRPDPAGRLQALLVPWDLHQLLDADALPVPPRFDWPIRLALFSAVLLVLVLILALWGRRHKKKTAPVADTSAPVPIKRISSS